MGRMIAGILVGLMLVPGGCAGAQRGDETRTESEAITAEHLEKVLGREVTAAEVRKANETLWRMEQTLRKGKRFLIEGQVVGEDGAALTDVTVGIVRVLPGSFFNWESRHESKRIQVNKTFRIEEARAEGIKLLFMKGGYYDQQVEFYSEDISALAEAIRTRSEYRGMTVGPLGLRVMLEKRGAITRLKKQTEGVLRHEASGKGAVLAMGEKPGFEEVANVEDEGRLPAECIYVLAEKDEQGQIKNVVYHPQYNLSLSEYFPAKIRLIYRGGDGGFVRYQPRNTNKAFHEMRQAPEGGYEKEIVVDLIHAFDKQVLTTDMGRYDKFWFYWKIGGKYGKGVAGFWTQKWPIPTICLGLYVQPDGSRNLEDPVVK